MNNTENKRPIRAVVMTTLTFLFFASVLGQLWLLSLGIVESGWIAVIMAFMGLLCWVASFEVPA